MSFVIYLLLMVHFLSSPVPVLIPRMAPRNGNIAISLRLLALFSLPLTFLHTFGLRLSPPLSILSTCSPQLFFRVVVLASACSLVPLGMPIFVCSGVCVMSYCHLVSGRSSLPSPLRVSFWVTVPSIRVTTVMTLLHAISVFPMMSPSLRIVCSLSRRPPLVPVPPLPRSMSSFLLFLRIHHLCYHRHLL